MIKTILNGLLPVAFVIVLGWLSGRIGLLRHADADVLATLVIRYALPLSLLEGRPERHPTSSPMWSWHLLQLSD